MPTDKELIERAKTVVAQKVELERQIVALLEQRRAVRAPSALLDRSSAEYQALEALRTLRPLANRTCEELVRWLPFKESAPKTLEQFGPLTTSPAARALAASGAVAAPHLIGYLQQSNSKEDCELAIACLEAIDGRRLAKLRLRAIREENSEGSPTARERIDSYLAR